VRLGDQRAHVVDASVPGPTFILAISVFRPAIIASAVRRPRDDQRHRHAALAAGAVGRAHHGADGVADVGVGHHDRVVLGAAQRLHAFAVAQPVA
jgi:hypothetical protein